MTGAAVRGGAEAPPLNLSIADIVIRTDKLEDTGTHAWAVLAEKVEEGGGQRRRGGWPLRGALPQD